MPGPLRKLLHSARGFRRRRRFAGAMRRLARDPLIAADDRDLLAELVRGWANEGWSAWEEFLTGCAAQARVTRGPILECGSGLTTLLIGTIAQARGLPVWALEHSPAWGAHVLRALAAHRIRSVRLCLAPMTRYGGFTWYTPPLSAMPERFSLVVCDGPPAGIEGGRVGLVPVMRHRLAPGAVILLDDAGRRHERAIASRWAKELGAGGFRLVGKDKSYIQLTLPDPGQPPVVART